MNNNLDTKARVALDLLAQGADEVRITDTDFVVRKRSGYEKQGSRFGNTQIVNVNTSASASSSSNIAAQFSILRQELKEIYEDDNKLHELENKIAQIEVEINKRSSDKSKLSNLLHWISDFNWDIYLKIIPIILGKFS